MRPVPARPTFWSRSGVGALVIAAAALWAYRGTFSAPFLFDDLGAIVNNPSIRQWTSALFPPSDGSGAAGRPVVNLSFALNYAIGGLRVEGYHAFNLALHVSSAVLLFGLARRTLGRLARLGQYSAGMVGPMALAIGGLWSLHPIQTESVTCVVQRTELLVGFFYLLTLYAFARSLDESPSRRWAVVAVVGCTLGMLSKEVMVSAPLMVFLYDRTFAAGTFRLAWRHRSRVHLALAATSLPLAWLVVSGGGARGTAAGFGLGVPWHAYALKQCEAITLYLQRALWPHPLVLDYGTSTAVDSRLIGWQALLLGALLFGTIFALRRRPAMGFLGAWFFVILAPSSSVLPLVTQTMAEHRMYLPLAAVVALVAIMPRLLRPRGILVILIAVASAMGWLTASRNASYRSAIAIWQDTVASYPSNSRAYNNLGLELSLVRGREPDALAAYQHALDIDPNNADAHYNLANELAKLPGRAPEAIVHYEEVVRVNPDYAAAHNNLALLLMNSPDRLDEAYRHLKRALQAKPDTARLHNSLGLVLSRMPGHEAEAQAAYREALRIDPAYADAHYNLGTELAKIPGQSAGAVQHYEEALRLNPSDTNARYNLAVELTKIPTRRSEAIAQYEQLVRAQPSLAEAHNNLAIEYAIAGRTEEARQQFQAALAVNPNFISARENLNRLQRKE